MNFISLPHISMSFISFPLFLHIQPYSTSFYVGLLHQHSFNTIHKKIRQLKCTKWALTNKLLLFPGAAPKLPLTTLTFSLRQVSTVETAKPTVEVKVEQMDMADGGCFSRNSGSFTPMTNHDTDEKTGDVDLDCVGRSAMLTHPTASRVRAPRRRPPTSVPAKEVSHNKALSLQLS